MSQVLRIVLHDQPTFSLTWKQHSLGIRKAEDIKWQAAARRYRCALQDGTLQDSWSQKL